MDRPLTLILDQVEHTGFLKLNAEAENAPELIARQAGAILSSNGGVIGASFKPILASTEGFEWVSLGSGELPSLLHCLDRSCVTCRT